jgi:hypothetical protein
MLRVPAAALAPARVAQRATCGMPCTRRKTGATVTAAPHFHRPVETRPSVDVPDVDDGSDDPIAEWAEIVEDEDD